MERAGVVPVGGGRIWNGLKSGGESKGIREKSKGFTGGLGLERMVGLIM